MLEHESSQVRFVITAVNSANLNFTPKDEMRPLIDLLNHVAQIPLIDFKFFTKEFTSFDEVRKMEKDLRRESIEDLLKVYDEGIENIKKYFSKLTDEQVKEFTDKCTELIAEGEKPSISVPSCLDYFKQQNQSDGGEATPRETESVVLQLKFMGKKLKVTGGGDAPTIKTDLDSDDMEEFNRLMEIVQSHICNR